MNGKFFFAGSQAGIGFIQRRADILRAQLTKDEKTGRVGMPSHVDFMRARQHVKRGMFKRMIAPGFKDIGEVKYHDFIIA
jgi:hypothetical protein